MIGLTGQGGSVTVSVNFDYLRVLDDIVARIRSGEYPPGHRLQSARELAEQYRVSVGTVRKAIDLLKDRGVLEGHQGKGVFVATARP